MILSAVFRKTYLREFGFDLVGRSILIDDIRVRARGKTASLKKIPIAEAQGPPRKLDTAPCYFEDGWHETDLYDLDDLLSGHTNQRARHHHSRHLHHHGGTRRRGRYHDLWRRGDFIGQRFRPVYRC